MLRPLLVPLVFLVAPSALAQGTCEPDWIPTFGAQPGFDAHISALTVFDDGSGPALYAGGSFQHVGSTPTSLVARWDGSGWSAVGGGIPGGSALIEVKALEVFDDGSGPALFVGGRFEQVGGGVMSRAIAKWDGSSWSGLAGGMQSPAFHDVSVYCMAAFDDGNGPALYAGGYFTNSQSGDAFSNGIAKWDGTGWSGVGNGFTQFIPGSSHQGQAGVRALKVFDDGNGDALYAGGVFTYADGAPALRIARWDGTSWTEVGGGIEGYVDALEVFDDGSGPALYVGGWFQTVGGTLPLSNIARWSGASWSALDTGLGSVVEALAVYDEGQGPALFAGGQFLAAGGTTVNRVARWNGQAWSDLSGGVDGTSSWHGVRSFTVYDAGEGPALIVGGAFQVGGESHFGRWLGCLPPVGHGFCFGDASTCPCGNVAGPLEGCANSASEGAELGASGSAQVAADDLLLKAGRMLPGQPALLFAGSLALGNGLPLGDGLLCVAGTIRRFVTRVPNTGGRATWGPGLASAGGYTPGMTAFFQVIYRDSQSPCGSGFNFSNSLEIAFH